MAREEQLVVVRYSDHILHPPNCFVPSLKYIMLTDCGEPSCYKEACRMVDSKKWQLAMQSKMTTLHVNQMWDLVPLPKDKKALPCKLVYQYKLTPHDGQPKYKAQLVAKGFKQEQGIDFDEVFLSVVKMTTLMILLALFATKDLHLHQMDVKTAFLHGDLHEEVYMH